MPTAIQTPIKNPTMLKDAEVLNIQRALEALPFSSLIYGASHGYSWPYPLNARHDAHTLAPLLDWLEGYRSALQAEAERLQAEREELATLKRDLKAMGRIMALVQEGV